MNNIKRNRTLLFLLAVLLIINIIMLIFFFNMNKQEPVGARRVGFTERLQTQVGFTPQQMEAYEPKKKLFWSGIRKRFDSIKETKQNFYYQIYDPSITDSVLEAKSVIIGRQQKDLDLQVIRYYKDVRSLCTPDQLPKFDSLIPPIIERMTTRPRKK